MGTFQSGINNILGIAGVAATTMKSSIDKKNEAKAAEEKEKSDAAKAEAAKAEKEALKQQKEQEAEQKDIEAAKEKLSDARLMAVGYSANEIAKKKASAALGIQDSKLPNHIKQKTFDRRMANARAMEEIHNQFVQKKENRARIESIKSKDIAKAIKPDINKSIKAKGGNK